MTPIGDELAKLDVGGDPVLETVKWIALSVAGLIAAATPLMVFIRRYNSNAAANSRDTAEAALYANLSEQLHAQKVALDEIYREHNKLVLEHAKALARIEKVEEYENTIDALNRLLSEKDKLLTAKDEEIQRERAHNRELTSEIMRLKDRLGDLERRLLLDESRFLRRRPEDTD